MSTSPGPSRTRRTARSDEGFTILEVIVAIAIVTVVMAALTSLFTGTIKTTNHFRMQQSAIMLTTTAIDHARSIGAVDAVLGRDKTSVDAQFANLASTPVGPWLTSMDRLYGDGSYTADLPTTPVVQTAGDAEYQVNYVVGSCHRIFSYSTTSEDCTNGPKDSHSEYIDFTRVVVAVTWQDASCDAGICYHVSAVLLNGDEDPLFNMNYGDPPKPILKDCRDQEVFAGEYVKILLFGKTQPHEDPPLCNLEGGVPPFAWTWTQLPQGLTVEIDIVDRMAYIEGTVGDTPGTVETVLTASDAYSHHDDSNSFTWTIIDPQPTIDDIGDQRTRVGEEFTLAVSYTCPFGTCTFSLGEPDSIEQEEPPAVEDDEESSPDPDGEDPGDDTGDSEEPDEEPASPTSPVTIDADTGELSGTAPDLSTVVHGLTVTITASNGKHATTAPFDWSFTDGPVLPRIDNQAGMVGETVTVNAAGSCGNSGPCSYATTGAPWLTIDSSGQLTGSTTSKGSVDVTVTLTDAKGDSDSTTFTVTIYDATAIGAIADQGWTVDTEIEPITVSVACGREPCTFEPASGLPDGIDFDVDTGEISGKPTKSGTGTATITVTDKNDSVVSTEFDWTVYKAPRIGPIGDQVWTKDTTIPQFTVDFVCERPGCTVSATNLPGGVTMANNGKISGKPNAASNGAKTATVTVDDHNGTVVSASFAWTVKSNLTFKSIGTQSKAKSTTNRGSCRYNNSITLNLNTYTQDGLSPVIFELTNPVPSGASVSGSTLTLTSPCSTGSWTVNVRATDRSTASATTSFTWKVT